LAEMGILDLVVFARSPPAGKDSRQATTILTGGGFCLGIHGHS